MYLDIAGVMIVVIDVWQTIHMINKKGCEILGYTEKEIIGKNWFDNVIPDRLRRETPPFRGLPYYHGSKTFSINGQRRVGRGGVI